MLSHNLREARDKRQSSIRQQTNLMIHTVRQFNKLPDVPHWNKLREIVMSEFAEPKDWVESDMNIAIDNILPTLYKLTDEEVLILEPNI